MPILYDEVLGHPKAPEDLRRSTEAKLIQYKQKHLYSISSKDPLVKGTLRKDLEALVDGVILLRRPNEDVWTLYLEWQDYESFSKRPISCSRDLYLTTFIGDLDQRVLKTYIELFPESSTSNIAKGYLLFHNVSPAGEGEEGNPQEDLAETGLDILLVITASLFRISTKLSYRAPPTNPWTLSFQIVSLERSILQSKTMRTRPNLQGKALHGLNN